MAEPNLSQIYEPQIGGGWELPEAGAPAATEAGLFPSSPAENTLNPAKVIGSLLTLIGALVHVHDWENVRVVDAELHGQHREQYPLAGCYARCKSCGLEWWGRADLQR